LGVRHDSANAAGIFYRIFNGSRRSASQRTTNGRPYERFIQTTRQIIVQRTNAAGKNPTTPVKILFVWKNQKLFILRLRSSELPQ
jgi:hypothetical protein